MLAGFTLALCAAGAALAGPAPAAGHLASAAAGPPHPTAYVLRPGTPNVRGAVYPVDLVTRKAGAAIPVAEDSFGLIATPGRGTVYAGSFHNTTGLTPIQTATGKAGKPIAIPPGSPTSMALTPDGKTIVVTTVGSGGVTEVSTATNKVIRSVHIGNSPERAVITPDGKTAYIAVINDATGHDGRTAYVTGIGGNTITPISTATNTAEAPITMPGPTAGIAFTANGSTAYVSGFTGGVITPVSTATNRAGVLIRVTGAHSHLGAVLIVP